jgi:hypothetical protein
MPMHIDRLPTPPVALPAHDHAEPSSPGARDGAQRHALLGGLPAVHRAEPSGTAGALTGLPSPGRPSCSYLLDSPMGAAPMSPDEPAVSRRMYELSVTMPGGGIASPPASSGTDRARPGSSRPPGRAAAPEVSPTSSASGASALSDDSTSTASSAGAGEPANELEALGYKKKQVRKVKAEAWNAIVAHHEVLTRLGFDHEDIFRMSARFQSLKLVAERHGELLAAIPGVTKAEIVKVARRGAGDLALDSHPGRS